MGGAGEGADLGGREEAALGYSGMGGGPVNEEAFQQATGNTLLGLRAEGLGSPGAQRKSRALLAGDRGQRQGRECQKVKGQKGLHLKGWRRGWEPALWAQANWHLLPALPSG